MDYLFDYVSILNKIEGAKTLRELSTCEILVGKYIDVYEKYKVTHKYIKLLINIKNEKKEQLKEENFNENK